MELGAGSGVGHDGKEAPLSASPRPPSHLPGEGGYCGSEWLSGHVDIEKWNSMV